MRSLWLFSFCHLKNQRGAAAHSENQNIYNSTPPNFKWLVQIFLKIYFRNKTRINCELGLMVILVHINKQSYKQILQLLLPNYYCNIFMYSMLSTTLLSQVQNHIQSIIQIPIENKTLDTNLGKIPNWLNMHSLFQVKSMGRGNGNHRNIRQTER